MTHNVDIDILCVANALHGHMVSIGTQKCIDLLRQLHHKVIQLLSYLFLVSTQSFRVRPENMTIYEGSTAILECSVDNMQGQLQWAKDGAILGKLMKFDLTS